MLTRDELNEFMNQSMKQTNNPVPKSISHLDFLLDCTDAVETSVKVEGDKKIVRATFFGSEDLSWTEYEYVFDLNGCYISHKEVDHHW